ncbi:SDR family oxidoreductase [Aspergillus lucknowensis]|uniref:NAD(P)-binding protein n=1 Tax=Aspergillus lucknowensis TaxID=176173 RepID=A0ABR4LL72_9EURO
MASTIYLITGASRGIGRGFVEALLARPDTTVVAAVRNPTSETSQSLKTLTKGPGSLLILVKVDSKSPTNPATAIRTLQDDHGIDHLDVVIANAGISEDLSTVHTVPLDVLKEHVEVNAYGPLLLYQAAHPLLKRSTKPIFVGVGSALGTIGGMEQRPFPIAAYGPSKAMLHWFVRKIHLENEDFISFVSDPGYVLTDMTNKPGIPTPSQTVGETVDAILRTIDGATRETEGGKWRVWDGSEFPW